MSIDWPRFRGLLQKPKRFLLTSHVRPDADSLGSELGMAGVLGALGKEVRIVNAQATPPHLTFLDPHQRIGVLGRDVEPSAILDADALLVVDTSAWVQLGDMADVVRQFRGQRIVLDHHQSADDLKAEMFRDELAEATGRLVVDAAEALGVALDEQIATPLFAAIATDTGWFRFSSVSPVTYQTVAKLVQAGANPAAIYASLFEQDSFARLALMGRVLSSARTVLEGRLIYIAASEQDFVDTGALRSDTEDIVNQTLCVAGTEVALFFVAQTNGRIKVSFRSRRGFDVAKLAEQFGGGGHAAAAGAMLDGSLDSVIQRVLDGARARMR